MRTIWLASYPKSGNTWMRLLIANLRRDAPVDINDLPRSGGIASGRGRFDNVMMFPSGLLTHAECDAMRPRVYQAPGPYQTELPEDDREDDCEDAAIDRVRFVKTHDAYTRTASGEPLLGGAAAAAGAILIVRDPRDVAPSFANHSAGSIDATIETMASPDSAFCGRSDRQHQQMRQQLGGWSRYHAGWLAQRDLPLHIVRYEDLHDDAAATLHAALDFAGVAVTRAEVEAAAHFAAFDELQRQEREGSGFREAPRRQEASNFFRRGRAGGWRDELTAAQIARIEADHGAMMARFGYAAAVNGFTGEWEMTG